MTPRSVSTEPNPNRTYFGVQALRAVAALLVVVHHAESSWRDRLVGSPQAALPWPNGQSGVDIFFVISGFVMAISLPGLAGRANPGGVFLWRRFVRIIPLYWIFTTLKLLRYHFGPQMADQSPGNAWHIIASYLFVPAADSYGAPIPLLAVGWTLNFEMMFYLLFALALILEIAPVVFLIPTLGMIAVVGWFDHPGWPAWTSLASPLVLEFLYGVLLAQLTIQRRLPGLLAASMLFFTGFILILCVPLPLYAARAFVWGWPAAAIVTGIVALEDRLGRSLPKSLLEIGNASYSIYLVHLFVISIVWVAVRRLGLANAPALAAMVVVSLVLSTLAGEIVHRCVELPLMKLLRGKRVRGVSVLPT